MNDSRPAGTRLRLSTLGDISAALAAELKEHADFQTDGQGDTDAVLVDGGTTIDDEALGGALKSGQPVIIAWPTEQSLSALLALTGQSIRGNPDAVIYRRLPHNGYVCHIVGDSEQPVTGMVGSSGAIRLGPPLGPALAKSLAALPDGSSVAQSMFAKPDTLAGYAIFSLPAPNTMPAPGLNQQGQGTADDLILGSTSQPMDAPFTVTAYVYYVNGGTNAGISPYYAVFISVSGTSQCLPLSNAGNDRGWFRPAFGSVTIPPLYFYGPNNQTALPTLIGSSPDDADGALVNIELSDTFPLIGNTGAGINPYEFSPQLGEQVTYADWAVRRVPLTNYAGTQAWELYQLRPWNVLTMPPKTMTSNQLAGFFDGNDTVLAMSDLAVSNLQFLNLTEWSFIPLGPTPTYPYDSAPSTPVVFGIRAYLLMVLMHNESACAQDEKMMWYAGDGSPSIPAWQCCNFWPYLDLGVIANSKSLAKPS